MGQRCCSFKTSPSDSDAADCNCFGQKCPRTFTHRYVAMGNKLNINSYVARKKAKMSPSLPGVFPGHILEDTIKSSEVANKKSPWKNTPIKTFNSQLLSPHAARSTDNLLVQSIGTALMETWNQQRLTRTTEIDLTNTAVINLVDESKLESLDHAALRLRKIINEISDGSIIPPETLIQNLIYCVKVLEAAFLKFQSRSSAVSSDDFLSDTTSAAHIPRDILDWLEQTFSHTKRRSLAYDIKPGKSKVRPTWRAAVRMVQAQIVFDRIFQKLPNEIMQDNFSKDTLKALKNIDKWSFDVFEMDFKCPGNTLKCVFFKLFTKYDLVKRFKIPANVLLNYSNKLQEGYAKFNNPYHNMSHAADVAQTVSCLLNESGFSAWLTDVDLFAILLAAIVHDVEHTGTTNAFHIETRSTLATLYNDKSVLEQHHISSAFRYMQENNCNIMRNFTREEYGDCRAMMVEMVLATDMNLHLELLRHVDSISDPLSLEKSKALCLVVHAADVNHPTKAWKLHHKWTNRVLEEFFMQGDRERKLGIPISPLCDRHTSKVAISQIGFIDFVIVPTYTSLFRVFNESLQSTSDDITSKSDNSHFQKNVLKTTFGDLQIQTLFPYDPDIAQCRLTDLQETCFKCIANNREEWLKRDKIEEDLNLVGIEALKYHISLSYSTAIPEESIADLSGKSLHGVSKSSIALSSGRSSKHNRALKQPSMSLIGLQNL